MAPAVGPKGHVTVWEPTQFYDKDSHEKFAAFQQKTPNTHLIVSPFEGITLDQNAYDFMTSEESELSVLNRKCGLIW